MHGQVAFALAIYNVIVHIIHFVCPAYGINCVVLVMACTI